MNIKELIYNSCVFDSVAKLIKSNQSDLVIEGLKIAETFQEFQVLSTFATEKPGLCFQFKFIDLLIGEMSASIHDLYISHLFNNFVCKHLLAFSPSIIEAAFNQNVMYNIPVPLMCHFVQGNVDQKCNKLYGQTIKYIQENHIDALITFNQIFKLCSRLNVFEFTETELNHLLIVNPAKNNRDLLRQSYLANLKSSENLRLVMQNFNSSQEGKFAIQMYKQNKRLVVMQNNTKQQGIEITPPDELYRAFAQQQDDDEDQLAHTTSFSKLNEYNLVDISQNPFFWSLVGPRIGFFSRFNTEYILDTLLQLISLYLEDDLYKSCAYEAFQKLIVSIFLFNLDFSYLNSRFQLFKFANNLVLKEAILAAEPQGLLKLPFVTDCAFLELYCLLCQYKQLDNFNWLLTRFAVAPAPVENLVKLLRTMENLKDPQALGFQVGIRYLKEEIGDQDVGKVFEEVKGECDGMKAFEGFEKGWKLRNQ